MQIDDLPEGNTIVFFHPQERVLNTTLTGALSTASWSPQSLDDYFHSGLVHQRIRQLRWARWRWWKGQWKTPGGNCRAGVFLARSWRRYHCHFPRRERAGRNGDTAGSQRSKRAEAWKWLTQHVRQSVRKRTESDAEIHRVHGKEETRTDGKHGKEARAKNRSSFHSCIDYNRQVCSFEVVITKCISVTVAGLFS